MNRSVASVVRVCALASLMGVPVASSAATAAAFSNFGSGFSYDTTEGNTVGNDGQNDGVPFAEGDTFSPSFTGPLVSLQIALSCAFACPNNFTVSLNNDNGGQPGTAIESFMYAGTTLGTLGNNNTPVVLTSVLQPVLTGGTAYWVEVQPDSSNADSIAWNLNLTGDSSSEAISTDGGATWFAPSGQTPGAYEVNATTPEPASLGLLLGGGLLLGLFRKKLRVGGPDQRYDVKKGTRLRSSSFGRSSRIAFGLAILLGLFLSAPVRSFAASWNALSNLAPAGAGVMIELTDGTIMIQNGSSQNWMRLTPDATGSYVNGTWTANPIAPMMLDRLYFAAQVLQSGKVWVLGGEYSGPNLDVNITPYAEIWDPLSNTWSQAAPYPTENRSNHCGNRPVSSNTNEAAGSTVLTGIYSTALMQVGWTVSGSGIPTGTTITSVDSATQVSISNAATATQTTRVTFTGQTLACFGDDPAILLPNGDILAGNIFTNEVYTYSVANNSWSFTANKYYNDRSDEEGWAKLADNKVLTYDLFQTVSAANGNGYAELYDPSTQTWTGISPVDNTAHGTLPVLSSIALGYELGPTLRLQDGRIFQIGANQHTALYTESTNTWAAGPDIIGSLTNSQGTTSGTFGADDAPAAILPNGHVVLAADAGPAVVTTTGNVTSGSRVITNIPSTAGLQVGWSITGTIGSTTVISGSISSVDSATQVTASRSATATATGISITFGGEFSRPTQLFDFDPNANTLSPVSPAIPDSSLNSRASYVTRMLVLPTGQLLFSDSSNQLYVYTPDGTPAPALRPVVNKIAYSSGGVFTLAGKQLNGQSAGSAYGDDVQNDENYPIVRLADASGNVFYCRTTNWSSTGVGQSTTPETVAFTLNPAITAGNYTLVVTGAGISSFPTFINITQAEVNGQ